MSKTPRPVALSVKPEHIPEELKALPQWMTWGYVWQQEKWDKPPRHARTGRLASSTDVKTWSSFDDAIRTYDHRRDRRDLDGIGIAIREENGSDIQVMLAGNGAFATN
jgi:primase-polymerase (primpol)-like protein